MRLPEPAAEAAKWCLLVGLAYFSADAVSAVIGRNLEVPGRPLPASPIAAVLEDVPAQAAPPGLITLLRTTEPKGGGQPSDDPSAGGEASGTPAEAPQMVQVKLQGTMAASGGSGLAILEYQGASHVVGSGEKIGDFTLKSVTAYSVTLESQGQLFNLELNSQQGAPTMIAQARPATPTPAEQANQPPEEPEEAAGETTPIQRIDELRNILDNPEAFMGQGFNVKPEVSGDQVQGMRISRMNPAHPLARLGIQTGDLVKSLNGSALEGPESISVLYRVLRNSSTLTFEVERNGAPQTVEVHLE